MVFPYLFLVYRHRILFSSPADSLKFYRALFPERNFLYYLWCAWKQYHKFTDVYIHRFIPWVDKEAEFIRAGWEHLYEAVDKKTGEILLMSHIGNWELAAQTLNKKGLPIMLYPCAKQIPPRKRNF